MTALGVHDPFLLGRYLWVFDFVIKEDSLSMVCLRRGQIGHHLRHPKHQFDRVQLQGLEIVYTGIIILRLAKLLKKFHKYLLVL